MARLTCIGAVEGVNPWEHPVPDILYKYRLPERLQILTDCCVRFSQRAVFDDKHELQPPVAAFGTEEEIRKFIELGPEKDKPQWLKDAIVRNITTKDGEEKRIAEFSQAQTKSRDQFAVFCLTEYPDNEQMWNEYAAERRGFAVGFGTNHPCFSALREPGRLGKVEYSDVPIGTFLGSYGADAFFRKMGSYRYEAEWRSVRALWRLERRGEDMEGQPIYVAPFDPLCVREIVIRPECWVTQELRAIVERDARYRHVAIRTLP
jgi:hypothetical protein